MPSYRSHRRRGWAQLAWPAGVIGSGLLRGFWAPRSRAEPGGAGVLGTVFAGLERRDQKRHPEFPRHYFSGEKEKKKRKGTGKGPPTGSFLLGYRSLPVRRGEDPTRSPGSRCSPVSPSSSPPPKKKSIPGILPLLCPPKPLQRKQARCVSLSAKHPRNFPQGSEPFPRGWGDGGGGAAQPPPGRTSNHGSVLAVSAALTPNGV